MLEKEGNTREPSMRRNPTDGARPKSACYYHKVECETTRCVQTTTTTKKTEKQNTSFCVNWTTKLAMSRHEMLSKIKQSVSFS